MKPQTIQVLSLSDLHFNPCYDVSLVPKLEESPVSEWQHIFEQSEHSQLSTYGEDTNYPLLMSCLEQLSTVENLSFALFSGDFLGHDLRRNYESACNDFSMTGFEAFITKTFQFLVSQFQTHLPGVTMYPTLGNDDSFDGDYKIEAHGAFLSMVHKEYQTLCTLPESFKAGGQYSVSIPELHNNQLIVINNTFMSTRYPNDATNDMGDEQIGWLRDELQKAKRKNVWLLFHEPLGINIYPTVHRGDEGNPANVALFLKKQYYDSLLELLKTESDHVSVLFSGHTHMDSFRLLHNDNKEPVLFNHITPAVSPIFGNNPGFQVFTVDVETNTPLDRDTYYLDLNDAALQWQLEYRFGELYGTAHMTPNSMHSVWNTMGDGAEKADYMKLYDVKSGAIAEKNWKVYYETMNELDQTGFSDQFKSM